MDNMRKLLDNVDSILSNQKSISQDNIVENEDDSMLEEENESYDMVVSALRNIQSNVAAILNNLDQDRVKENLTEPWILGIIAVVEDNVSNIHDFVKFSGTATDNQSVAGLSYVCDNCGAINDIFGGDTLIEESFTCSVCKATSSKKTKAKPGLWDNIRKKKQKEGKNYRPAKPGDKDRPDPDQWKKLTKDSK